MSKISKFLGPKVGSYIEFNFNKEIISMHAQRFEFGALFDFAESCRLLTTKRRKSDRSRKSQSKKSDSF